MATVTNVGNGGVSGFGTSHAFTMPADVNAGDLAVLAMGSSPGDAVRSVTDSRGNTWTVYRFDSNGTTGYSTSIAYSTLTTKLLTGDTVTCTSLFGFNDMTWHMASVTGPQPIPADGNGGGSGLQGGGAPSWSMTPGGVGDICFSILSITDTNGSYNGQSGWTTLSASIQGTVHTGFDWTQNAATPITVAPSFTLDRNWVGTSVAFGVQTVGGQALVTQDPSEAIMSSADTQARVTQDPVEAVTADADSAARVTQDPVESVTNNAQSVARVTQDPVEVIAVGTNSEARATQVVVEVIIPMSEITGGFLGRLPLLGAG